MRLINFYFPLIIASHNVIISIRLVVQGSLRGRNCYAFPKRYPECARMHFESSNVAKCMRGIIASRRVRSRMNRLLVLLIHLTIVYISQNVHSLSRYLFEFCTISSDGVTKIIQDFPFYSFLVKRKLLRSTSLAGHLIHVPIESLVFASFSR